MATTMLIGKYAAFSRISLAQAQRERGEIYGRMVFFVVVLGVFSSLWHAVAEAGMPVAADAKALVWYLAATEWIYLSAPPIFVDIQEAIRRGDVVYRLGRPASFVLSEFASAVGLMAVRAPALAVTAWLCAYAFTGWVPPASTLALVLLFGLVAMALITAMYIGIGLLAFWLHDITPVHWVWQKLMFVCGGLMLPLELYPSAIQQIAALTPFPVVLTQPASFVLRTGSVTPLRLATDLLMWCCIAAVVVMLMFRRATSALTVNGG